MTANDKKDVVKERSEILFLYETKDCNPNGDPLDENKPRTDPETGVATVTDVRIKRWIRDYWQERLGESIWVMEERKEDATLQEAFERARKLMEKTQTKPEELQKSCEALEKFTTFVLESWIDTRVFGCTMPTAKRGAEGASPTVTLTGPVQISGFNRSLHRVSDRTLVQGTAAFATEGSYQRSFREDHILPYACISAYGVVNEIAAKTTKMTEEDRKLLLEGLWLGCKDLISRSKIGHQPLLILHVIYKDGYRIGDLAGREKIELIPEKRDGKKIEEKALRSTADFKVNIGGLCNALKDSNDKIDHVELKHDIRLRLCMPSKDPQGAFSNISDLEKYLKGLDLKVTSLDLDVPSKTGNK